MANTKSNSLHVNAVPGRRMTRTALRRLYAKLEPMTQLDLFGDRDCVAYQAREQLCRADRMAEAAGLKPLPLIRKRSNPRRIP